ncbi:DNA mismatch repair protein MutS [bacterium]|nr:DNA mismatch repair protein MutS [bacterium]
MPYFSSYMGTPANVTPMLAQYLEMKRQYPDAILFYRMGDFYEMFFEDAVLAAPVLEVQLTARDKNAANPIPMCGVPHHSAISYIQKILAAGMKVALCEQMEDPATTKGLVKRDVVRVLTPALIADPELVQDDQKYQLLAIAVQGGQIGLCLLDLLDGQLRTGTADSTAAVAEVFREYRPREILTTAEAAQSDWLKVLTAGTRCLVTTRDSFFAEGESLNSALEALRKYIQETQKTATPVYFENPAPLFAPGRLSMDSVTLASLEIARPANEGGKSLTDVIDDTVTSMGRRLLRDWLTQPSRDVDEIEGRLESVSVLLDSKDLAEALRSVLSPLRDLERLSTKTSLGLAMPRDLVAIRDTLARLPEIQELLKQGACERLETISQSFALLPELVAHLQEALEDSPPATYREGGIFRASFHPEIQEYRTLAFDAKSAIAAMEERERQRTGISSLKIKFNKVFGYTIEVTNSHLSKIPDDYTRKQTISTGERFVTEELKNFEQRVIRAEHRLKALEESLFLEARQKVAAVSPALSQNARLLAETDVLQSFARAARQRGYRRPVFNNTGKLEIEDGRHPVVEVHLPPGQFVANSITICQDSARTLIITGPNMGGKSTIMRQVALTSVLAQAGSFVPAQSANLPLLDAIFTRIGSSDNLSQGQSTFMVEMHEVARILRSATPQSLILIDEIGRGTSTYDGLALAWSLLEYLHNQVGAKTLFATHFHEITALEGRLPGLKNLTALVEKWKDDVVFLYKVAPGVCSRSYGIEVAKIAGVPSEVLTRARDIQTHLENQSQKAGRARNAALSQHTNQMDFFESGGSPESLAPLEP